MELLIPGLILVAVMVYVSTRIKKRAADAFNAESINADGFSLEKPEGFLHVVGDERHEFMAYSKEVGEDDNSSTRRATIELDVLPEADVASVRKAICEASVNSSARQEDVLETDEGANETEFRAVYKLAARGSSVYRLRFAVLAEHFDEFSRRIDDTIESFVTKPGS